MPGDPRTDVDIYRHDDGSIVMVFGAGTPASDLATAFASLPRDALMSDITRPGSASRTTARARTSWTVPTSTQ
jgi:hypothetical protein